MQHFSALKLVVVAVAFLFAAQAQAVLVQTVIYQQDFNAGLPGDMTTISHNVDDILSSNLGAAQLDQGINQNLDFGYLTNATFSGELFTVEADLNQINGSPGNTVSGIVIGNRYFSFFPGYVGGGAFDIWGYNTTNGSIASDYGIYANMGFVPAQGVYHHMKIDVNPFTNTFDIYLYNNADLNSTPYYYQLANDAGFVPGKIGFNNYSGGHTTLYDNLTVTALRELVLPVPEPSTALLMGLGLVGLSARRRKARGANSLSDVGVRPAN